MPVTILEKLLSNSTIFKYFEEKQKFFHFTSNKSLVGYVLEVQALGKGSVGFMYNIVQYIIQK